MKYVLIMLMIVLAPDVYGKAGSMEEKEEVEELPDQARQVQQQRFFIRTPDKEEIPKPVEEAKPTETTQTQQKAKESCEEDDNVDAVTSVDEDKSPSQDATSPPEKPKDNLETGENNGDSESGEKTVITPTRTKQLLKNSGSSVSVITQKDIESRKTPLLLDVLRQAPGLEVTRTQGIGGTTSLFIRGASSAQTLVFVDGVRMNSPTTGAFDFANLTTDNIERVEILRGPQSTLYGSEAIGGVINIITKRGAGDTKVALGTEYGTHDTLRENVGVSGGKEKFDYSVGASYLKTHGISAASSGSEADGYENFTGSSRLGWNFLDNGRVDTTIRSAHSDFEYDAFEYGIGPVDDHDGRQTTDENLFSTKVNKTFFDMWTPSFLVSINDTELKGFDPTDEWNEFRISTRVWRFEHQSDFTLFDINTVTLGYEHEVAEGKNDGQFDKTFWNNALFFQNQIELFESLHWTAGLRYDDYSTFGNNLTYRTTMSYNLEDIDTRLHGSWGKGFRAPALNELFFPFYGNPNLRPEESTGWDFGVEKEILKNKLIMDVTYFKNNFTNLIAAAVQLDGSYLAENVAKAEAEGIETALTYKPLTKLSLVGNYTYTKTQNRDRGQQLSRRPENRATLGINTQPLDKLNVNMTGIMVRDRIDSDGEEMDNYWTANMVTRYDITKSMTTYVRFENLFDYGYEEVPGFGTLGFTAYGGLEFKF